MFLNRNLTYNRTEIYLLMLSIIGYVKNVKFYHSFFNIVTIVVELFATSICTESVIEYFFIITTGNVIIITVLSKPIIDISRCMC